MKSYVKSLTFLLFVILMGSTAYGRVSGDIEFGVEVYDFEESTKSKNYYEPFVSYHLYPVEDSSLFIKGRSSVRDQYNVGSEGANDKRERHQIYLGYQWSAGKFSFEPAVGVRVEDFDDSKLNERNELRFVPTMTYRFNKSLQWYFTGYVGYVNVDGAEVNNKGEVTEEYENQRIRNLITGFRYRVTNDLRIDTAVQHKKREEWQGQYASTFYRTRINYDLYRNIKTRFTINGQVAYFPETETNKNGASEDDEFIYRLGFTLQQEIATNVDLIGKFYYQWRQQNVGSGSGFGNGGNTDPERFTEDQQFYSLALRMYF